MKSNSHLKLFCQWILQLHVLWKRCKNNIPNLDELLRNLWHNHVPHADKKLWKINHDRSQKDQRPNEEPVHGLSKKYFLHVVLEELHEINDELCVLEVAFCLICTLNMSKRKWK